MSDHVTGCNLRPDFKRTVLLGEEATGMRLRVCEWLAEQILGSWATSMDLLQSVHTFHVLR